MKMFLIALSLFSWNALACWQVEGSLSVNDDKVEFHQKFAHNKTYSFRGKNHLFHMKLPFSQKKDHVVEIHIQRKEGVRLIDVANEKMLIQSDKKATMTKENPEQGIISTFTIKIMDI